MGSKLLTVAFLIILGTFYTSAQASSLFEAMDATDLCILSCEGCFEDKILVKCANTCIDFNGKVPPIWKLNCPLFNNPEKLLEM